MNLCYLRHFWVGLIGVWSIEWYLSSGSKRWLDFWLLHWWICVYMIVKQIDLFLHISLRQIYSSFLLCNKVSYLDLHSKCLNGLIRYLTFILWSTSIIVLSYSLFLSQHLLVWEYITWNRSVTPYVQLTYQ